MNICKSILSFLVSSLTRNAAINNKNDSKIIKKSNVINPTDNAILITRQHYPIVSNTLYTKSPHEESLKSSESVSNSCDSNPNQVSIVNDTIPSLNQEESVTELEEFIKKFNNNKLLKDLYNRVMDRINVPKEENLIFYSKFFLKNLASLIEKIESFSKDDYFWFDLSRLVFKRAVHLKQEMADATDDQLKEASKDIQSIAILLEKRNIKCISSKFNLKTMVFYSHYDINLLRVEILENYHEIKLQFTNALKDFYLNRSGTVDCMKFRLKYFPNGNPNKNFILKQVILKYDTLDFIKNYIIKLQSSEILSLNDSIKESVKSNFKYSNSVGPNYFDFSDLNYLSDTILDLYISTNSRFFI